jgi:hypothetical protein
MAAAPGMASPRRALARAALAAALIGAFAGPAAADTEGRPARPTRTIGVLEVATYGVSQAAGDKFEESVEETLAGVGFHVVRSSWVKEKLAGTNYVGGCTVGPCMREVLMRTGLRQVLVARIQGAGQSYSVVVSLVDTRSGELVSQVAQSCPVCTVEEAISTATLATVELLTARRGAGEQARALAVARESEREAGRAALARREARTRRFGWVFLLGGAALAGVGGGLLAADRDPAGSVSVGVGGGLAVAGVTALVWSKSF